MMKRILLALALALALPSAHAQTVTTAPTVLVCPAPLWPPAKCPHAPVFSALTNTANAAASISKTAPVWQHTYSGYATMPTLPLVACPAGATLSADATTCTSAGVDVSALTPAAAVPKFVLAVTAPAPATHDYPVTWSAVTQAVDGTAVTDIAFYNVQTANSLAGPWSTATQKTGLATTLTLPSDVVQCVAVAAVSPTRGTGAATSVCTPAIVVTPPPPPPPLSPPKAPAAVTVN